MLNLSRAEPVNIEEQCHARVDEHTRTQLARVVAPVSG